MGKMRASAVMAICLVALSCASLPEMGDENDLSYDEILEAASEVETVGVEPDSALYGRVDTIDIYRDAGGDIVMKEMFYTVKYAHESEYDREIHYLSGGGTYKIEYVVREDLRPYKGIARYVTYLTAFGKVDTSFAEFVHCKPWRLSGKTHYSFVEGASFRTLSSFQDEHLAKFEDGGREAYLNTPIVRAVGAVRLNGGFLPTGEAEIALLMRLYDEVGSRDDPGAYRWKIGVIESGKEYWMLCNDRFKDAVGKSFDYGIANYYCIGGIEEGPVFFMHGILY